MERKSFTASGGTIVYWTDDTAGSDAPQLVFLPGLTADHTLFDAQMAYFAGKAQQALDAYRNRKANAFGARLPQL